MGLLSRIVAPLLFSSLAANAQQYAGDFVQTNLPAVNGFNMTFFRVNDQGSLLNYYSLAPDGQPMDNSKIQRAIVVLHGSNRDGWNYAAHMNQALTSFTADGNINTESVAIMAPVFANQIDAGHAYPDNGQSAAMVWQDFQWGDGGNTISPNGLTTNTGISSYTALDQVIQYYNDAATFPNIKQIVIAGHSRGAQMTVRYAALTQVQSNVPVSFYIGNPNGYAWFTEDRPISPGDCSTFDNYGDGYANFEQYPMTYGSELVLSGRQNVQNNFLSKNLALAHGLNDQGDASDSCGPASQGANRQERFYNFIKAFPPTCANPNSQTCATVDYVNAGHDDLAMFSDPAGQARLFTDNFYGDGARAYDFGARQQDGDNPYPNPNA